MTRRRLLGWKVEGRVIADSLGGGSNAYYNITPQDTTLNRYGYQACMESMIRSAGGVTDFVASITYPDMKIQILPSYHYIYTLKGKVIIDRFDNINQDEVNEALGLIESELDTSVVPEPNDDLSSIDMNGNVQVTIQKAKYDDH